MIGYPYTYNDYLSEENAMRRRADFFDKGLVLFAFWSIWSLIPTAALASDVPKNNLLDSAATTASSPSPTPGQAFAPIAGVCACTSPRVKTAILLVGVSSICYCALCSKDKPLIIACSSIATYVATNLDKGN